MAHIGRLYKLQFRRDLANVENNVDAYPEAMIFFEDDIEGGVGVDIMNDPPLLVNLLKDSQPPMVWTSDVRNAAGVDYTCSLSITDPETLPVSTMQFTIDRFPSGANLLTWRGPSAAFGVTPARGRGGAGTVIHQDPLCHIPAGFPSWDYFAAGWGLYNP